MLCWLKWPGTSLCVDLSELPFLTISVDNCLPAVLLAANVNLDDDGIMVDIYNSIGDELKAKNKMLESEKQKVHSP